MTVRKTISLGAVWEDSWTFCRAEAGLLAPLALLGFGLPLVVLGLVVPADIGLNDHPTPGLWMLWLIPHLLLNLLGTLSLSMLAMRPGASVGEALRGGLGRLPAALGFVVLAMGAFLGMWIGVAVVAGIEMAVLGKPGPISLLLVLVGCVFFVWLSLRLLPIWAALALRGERSWPTAHFVFRLTRGMAGQLLGLRLVQLVSQFVVMSVITLPVHAIFGLIGKLAGAPDLGEFLADLVGCVAASVIITLWTVFVAQLYRRMETASGGT
jgi:hypothetical protein